MKKEKGSGLQFCNSNSNVRMSSLTFLFFLLIFSMTIPIFAIAKPVEEPFIIYLKGSCSAGKSTFIRALSLSRDNLEIIDEDALVHAAFPKAVAERFPLEYDSIKRVVDQENMYYALRTKHIIYKKNATEEECTNAAKAIFEIQNELNKEQNLAWKKGVSENVTQCILAKIQELLQNKKSILLDAWYISGEDLEALFPTTPVIRVMLYCSLPIAYKRLLQRNADAVASGNISEKRFIGQLAGSFCSLYKISPDPLQPIQNVDKDQLNLVFTKFYEMLDDEECPKSVFTYGEIPRSKLKVIQDRFMKPFENSELVKLYISPVEKQDLIIDNTEIMKSSEAIDALEKLLYNFQRQKK